MNDQPSLKQFLDELSSYADHGAAQGNSSKAGVPAIGQVLEIAGSGSRVVMDADKLNELQGHSDQSIAMSGQVGSQVKMKVGPSWLVANVRTLRAGDTVPAFPEVDVVHPPRSWTTASPNEGSLVLRVRVGATAMLFTGDAERDAEAAMLARPGALAATVLKVPHHGSRTSSATAFVARVGPALGVMSLGAENRFGHPAPDVVARYAAAGVAVARTDRCGAVTVVPDDDDGLTIETERPGCGALKTRRRP